MAIWDTIDSLRFENLVELSGWTPANQQDDTNIRESLSSILQKEGYETDVAENGREALQKSKNTF
jgi:hypothetical protein